VSTAIANPLGIGGRESAPWADRLFEEKSWNFGTVRRGEQVLHRFRLTNNLKQPIHISSLRLSAGFLQAAARIRMDDSEGEEFATTHAWIAPHQSADIWVQVDTGRFAGTKTSAVYVQFDQPAAAEVRLQVGGHSKEGTEPDNAPPGPRDPKMKIGELEHQIHQLMKEIDDLRDELKRQPAKPRSGSSRIETVPGTQLQRYNREPKVDDPAKP
jgi:hypothetical protein